MYMYVCMWMDISGKMPRSHILILFYCLTIMKTKAKNAKPHCIQKSISSCFQLSKLK